MSFFISAYSDSAFQEFILPQTDTTNHQLILDHTVFGTEKDVDVFLEIIEGEWRFKGVSEGVAFGNRKIPAGSPLKHGELIQLIYGSIKITLAVMTYKPNLNALQKYHVSQGSRISVGSEDGNAIRYNFNSLVTRRHAELVIDGRGCTLEDNSANGTFIGTKRVHHNSQKLNFGDCIDIFGLKIVWLGSIIAVGCADGNYTCTLKPLETERFSDAAVSSEKTDAEKTVRQMFRRSPRNMPKIFSDPVEIEDPPQPQRTGKRPLFLTIGPSLTMAIPMALGAGIAIISAKSTGAGASIYMFTGIIIAVASAIIGTIWALVNMNYSKKQEKANEALRIQKYREYIEKFDKSIGEQYQHNAKCMEEIYPSAGDCALRGADSPQLWSRNMTHDDFLFQRLGKGSIPFQSKICIQKKRFSLMEDELADLPGVLLEKYRTLKDVPVGIDLTDKRLVGIVGGGEMSRCLDIMRLLAVQTSANNCYTDVKMVFIMDGCTRGAENHWAFARWLPHVWSEDKKTRYVAATKEERSEVFFALANILRARAENESAVKKKAARPHYVVFIENSELLEGEPAAKFLLEPREALGVSTVMLGSRYEDLPNNCVNVIENSPAFTGMYNVETGNDEKTAIVFDGVSEEETDGFARRISNVEVSEPQSGGEIPDSLTFFDMYRVSALDELNVMDRWRKNRTYESMKALVGQKAGGVDWYLDIHEKYHGPHGLVAGTTGSGKSETLQTYMLSLAVNFSPNDIGFFVIDFKGGGMANLFSNLPHMVGQISNLSGNQIHRAMVSIKSENRRRQRIFGEYGVNHIDNYTRLFKSGEANIPIPHLFIIIDEFAELKREEPEFMRELISVAQVGRSLGVHLILATQKPSGTVDDNIWSNAKFRLCLRVQDRQDSNDMLHKPDAAYITQAGRCYMQVGNDEIYELFQSGWSGAEYDENAEKSGTEIASMKSNTGKPAIVGNHYKILRNEQKRINWLSALTRYIDAAGQAAGLTSLASGGDAGVDALTEAVYSRLEEGGYEYPRSKANSLRISEFIRVWDDCRLEPGTRETQVLAAADKIRSAGKKLPEIKGKTQLTAVVDYISRLAAENGYSNKFSLWLPVLPRELYLSQLHGYDDDIFDGNRWPARPGEWTLCAPMGLYDDPANQNQQPIVANLAENGHLAVCGTVVSGKSTFLQTLLYALVDRYSPDQLNVYAFDYSNRMMSVFAGLPHTGGVVYEDESEKAAKFFAMIQKILDGRKEQFSGGSFSQYVKIHGDTVPAIVIAIDNYANFREKTENKYEETMIELSRDGVNYGIFLAISSGGFGSAEIPNRIADNIRNVFCLELGDKFKYGDILRTIHFDVLPEANTRGRGLAPVGGAILEYQTALCLPADDDYARGEKMASRFAQMSAAWTGKHAHMIPSIPEHPTWADFSALDGFAEALEAGEKTLPYAYDSKDASIVGMDLPHTYCWLITGKPRSGKTNLLKILASSAAGVENSKRFIFEFDGSSLKGFAGENQAGYVTDSAGMYEVFGALVPEFSARNAKKRELIGMGKDEEEVFAEMCSFEPIFMFIDDLGGFIDAVYHPAEGVGSVAGFLENITEKGFLHNVFFIAGVNTNDLGKVMGRKVYDNMASFKTGIHLGGNVASQRLFDFSSMPYTEQTAVTRPGVGLVPSTIYAPGIKKVVIPDMKG